MFKCCAYRYARIIYQEKFKVTSEEVCKKQHQLCFEMETIATSEGLDSSQANSKNSTCVENLIKPISRNTDTPENSHESVGGSSSSSTSIKLTMMFGQKNGLNHSHLLYQKTPSQGHIFLTLPHGMYPFSVINEQQVKTVIHFVEKWILSCNLVKNTHPSSLRLEEYPIKHVFYLAPIFPKSPVGLKLKTFLKFAACLYVMDEFLWKSTSVDQTPFLPLAFFKDLKKIVTNIITGLYRHSDAVPYFEIPLFHHSLKALFKVQEDLRDCVGYNNYGRYHKYILREMLEWIDSYKIFTHNSVGTSQESCNWIFLSTRRFNGRTCFLEVIQMLDGAFVGDSIRDQRLFKLFYETGIYIHNLSLDLLSARKDAAEAGSVFNPKSFLARHYKHHHHSQKDCGIQESAHTLLSELNRAVIDFQKMSKGLVKEFSNYEPLKRFVRNYHNFIDGGILVLLQESGGSNIFEMNT